MTASRYLITFVMRLVAISVSVWGLFWIFCNEMCQHLEDLHNPVSQYFPNGQWLMLQNHAWVKTEQNKSVQVQDEPMVLMGQFINMASGSTLQLIFKELPLIEHLDGSVS